MEKIAQDETLSGAMADVTAAYHKGSLTAIAGVCSIGTSVKDGSGVSFSSPASAKAAAWYDLKAAEKHVVGIGAGADVYFNGGISAAAGLQYCFNDMLFVRAGAHYGTDSAPLPTYVGLGLGVKLFGVRLDVSYLTASQTVGGSLCAALGYSF